MIPTEAKLAANSVIFVDLLLRKSVWQKSPEVHSGCSISVMFKKTVILPPKPVGFRLTYMYTQNFVRHIFHPICIRFAWIKRPISVHFLQSYKEFCKVPNEPISTHWSHFAKMWLNNNDFYQFWCSVMYSAILLKMKSLKSSTIFLLHLELKCCKLRFQIENRFWI